MTEFTIPDGERPEYTDLRAVEFLLGEGDQFVTLPPEHPMAVKLSQVEQYLTSGQVGDAELEHPDLAQREVAWVKRRMSDMAQLAAAWGLDSYTTPTSGVIHRAGDRGVHEAFWLRIFGSPEVVHADTHLIIEPGSFTLTDADGGVDIIEQSDRAPLSLPDSYVGSIELIAIPNTFSSFNFEEYFNRGTVDRASAAEMHARSMEDVFGRTPRAFMLREAHRTLRAGGTLTAINIDPLDLSYLLRLGYKPQNIMTIAFAEVLPERTDPTPRPVWNFQLSTVMEKAQ